MRTSCITAPRPCALPWMCVCVCLCICGPVVCLVPESPQMGAWPVQAGACVRPVWRGHRHTVRHVPRRCGVQGPLHLAWAYVGKWLAPENRGEAMLSGSPGCPS